MGIRKFFGSAGIGLVGAAAFAACGSRELKIDINPTYSDINRIVVQTKCLQCHTSLATYAGLKAIVNPGNAADSDFYNEVAEGGMPMQSAPLSDKEVAAIRDWIDAGAQNN